MTHGGKQNATLRESHELAKAIKELSARTRKHVEHLSKGQTEVRVDTEELVKLKRWEEHSFHLAKCLGSAFEAIKPKPPPQPPRRQRPGRPAAGNAMLGGQHHPFEAKQPLATFGDMGPPLGSRAASQVYGTGFAATTAFSTPAFNPAPDMSSVGLFAPRIPVVGREQRMEISTPLSPGMKPAEVAATGRQPRVQMPPFVINPHKYAKEKGGPDLHPKEKDFGASARECFKYYRGRGERDIEATILRKHEWRLSMVADLPDDLGYAGEGDDAKPSLEGNIGQAAELEGVPGAQPPVKLEQRGPKQPAFTWREPQVKQESFTAQVNMSEGDMASGVFPRKKVKIEEVVARYQDSSTQMEDARFWTEAPFEKTFSIDERLPKYGSNVRGRFFDPNDPRRDTLRLPGRENLQEVQSSSLKRRRSPPPGAPPNWHPNGKAICMSCRQTDDMCTSNGQCVRCVQSGLHCLYVLCSRGLGCQRDRCTLLHPGQFAEQHSGEWSAIADT